MNRAIVVLSFFLLAPGIAITGARDASAQQDLVIGETFINEAGDLEISFSDVLPTPMNMRYDAHSIAELTFVCADAARRPSWENRYRQTIRAVVERSVQFSTEYMGQIRGFVTLNYPRNQENLLCTPGMAPTLAAVNYSEIRVRNQFGVSAGAKNVGRVFIRLPTLRLVP